MKTLTLIISCELRVHRVILLRTSPRQSLCSTGRHSSCSRSSSSYSPNTTTDRGCRSSALCRSLGRKSCRRLLSGTLFCLPLRSLFCLPACALFGFSTRRLFSFSLKSGLFKCFLSFPDKQFLILRGSSSVTDSEVVWYSMFPDCFI